MLAVQILLTRIQSLVKHTILQSNTSHGAEALTLDKDFAFLALVRTNLIAVEVVGAQIPLAIPTMLLHGINHGINAALSTLGFLVFFDFVAKFHIRLPVKTNKPAIIRLSAFDPSLLFSVVWKLSLGSHEKQFKFRQSFQSARPMSGNI